ncbi:hypothetical protein MJO29_004628 [Puccinia striiformis f. sp. tritici]|nr:hypothetical protein MJO29_004628 [Puccinia striiformis f. sp. tritici]
MNAQGIRLLPVSISTLTSTKHERMMSQPSHLEKSVPPGGILTGNLIHSNDRPRSRPLGCTSNRWHPVALPSIGWGSVLSSGMMPVIVY